MIGQKGSLLSVEIVAVAMAAIRANALRSVLTTLGIIIGVAAVITMVSLGEGAQQQIQAQIEGMGTNILSISPTRGRGQGGVPPARLASTWTMPYALRDNSGGLLKVAPGELVPAAGDLPAGGTTIWKSSGPGPSTSR